MVYIKNDTNHVKVLKNGVYEVNVLLRLRDAQNVMVHLNTGQGNSIEEYRFIVSRGIGTQGAMSYYKLYLEANVNDELTVLVKTAGTKSAEITDIYFIATQFNEAF